MTGEENLTKKRFEELAERSYSNGIYTFTEFLSPGKQALLRATVTGVPYSFFGGFDGAEKAIAVFGSEELCGYAFEPPVTFIKIEPSSSKFSDDLSHRDFLGSIISLGIKRSTLGDIVVKDNCGYTVCFENIADYICNNLLSIKHTSVRCSVLSEFPKDIIPAPVESEFVVASERLDSFVSSIYKISRSESRNLVEHEKVAVGGIPVTNADYQPKEDDIITVRGHGKFIYAGLERETKKGRLRCKAKIYR